MTELTWALESAVFAADFNHDRSDPDFGNPRRTREVFWCRRELDGHQCCALGHLGKEEAWSHAAAIVYGRPWPYPPPPLDPKLEDPLPKDK